MISGPFFSNQTSFLISYDSDDEDGKDEDENEDSGTESARSQGPRYNVIQSGQHGAF
jgi:hypothetical protein